MSYCYLVVYFFFVDANTPCHQNTIANTSAMNTGPHYEHSNVKRAIGCHEIWIWLSFCWTEIWSSWFALFLSPFFLFQQNYINSWCRWMIVSVALIPKTKRCNDQIKLNDKRQHTFYAANYFWLLLWFFNIKPSFEIWNRYI